MNAVHSKHSIVKCLSEIFEKRIWIALLIPVANISDENIDIQTTIVILVTLCSKAPKSSWKCGRLIRVISLFYSLLRHLWAFYKIKDIPRSIVRTIWQKIFLHLCHGILKLGVVRLYLRFSWSLATKRYQLHTQTFLAVDHTGLPGLGWEVPLEPTLSTPVLLLLGDRVLSISCGRRTAFLCFWLSTDFCKC